MNRRTFEDTVRLTLLKKACGLALFLGALEPLGMLCGLSLAVGARATWAIVRGHP